MFIAHNTWFVLISLCVCVWHIVLQISMSNVSESHGYSNISDQHYLQLTNKISSQYMYMYTCWHLAQGLFSSQYDVRVHDMMWHKISVSPACSTVCDVATWSLIACVGDCKCLVASNAAHSMSSCVCQSLCRCLSWTRFCLCKFYSCLLIAIQLYNSDTASF